MLLLLLMHRHPIPRPSLLGRRLHVHPLPLLGRWTSVHHWLHGVHSVGLLGRSARMAVVLRRGSGVAALHLLLLLGWHAAGWSLHGVGVHGLGHCVECRCSCGGGSASLLPHAHARSPPTNRLSHVHTASPANAGMILISATSTIGIVIIVGVVVMIVVVVATSAAASAARCGLL